MPRNKTTLAQKATQKRPRDNHAIDRDTTRITAVLPSGETIDIAVFDDHSFLLRQPDHPDDGLPRFRAPGKRSLQPAADPDPQPAPFPDKPSSLQQRRASYAATIDQLQAQTEQFLQSQWPGIDIAAHIADPYFLPRIQACHKTIAAAFSNPKTPRIPPTSLSKPHPPCNDPELSAHITADANLTRSRHPDEPGTTAPVPDLDDPAAYAAFNHYVNAVTPMRHFIEQPPATTIHSIPDTWNPYDNPFERHYIRTGQIPPIPQDPPSREIWWKFAEKYPEAAGTMFRENTRRRQARDLLHMPTPGDSTLPQFHLPDTPDLPPDTPDLPADTDHPLYPAFQAIHDLPDAPASTHALRLIHSIIAAQPSADNTQEPIPTLYDLAEQRCSVINTHLDLTPDDPQLDLLITTWRELIEILNRMESP